MVTSPTATPRTDRTSWQRLAVVGVTGLALLCGAAVPAHADDLDDQRKQVRAAIAQSKKDVASAKQEVSAANKDLASSQETLEAAQQKLSHLKEKLAKAKAEDARIAAALKAAQAALVAAKAKVEQGKADLASQKALIASSVRRAYQQQSDLTGLGIIFDTDSSADLANRIQWTDTIFDNSAAEMGRLKELQTALEAAEVEMATAEASVAEQKKLSEGQVAEVAALTSEAAAQQKKVAALVATNAEAVSQAEAELEDDKARYDELQDEDAKITRLIKAEIAKEKARKSKKKSSDKENSAGFVRPVNASAGSPYGLRFHPILKYWRMHWGTDFGARCGAPLYAMADGRVTSAGWQGGFGNYTIISYGKVKGDYVSSGYAHQSKIIVRSGQKVKQGQLVGYVGTTGLSTGCHLHLQIYRDGARVNPMKYL